MVDHVPDDVAARAAVEQARGVLMERHRVSPEQALDLLVEHSKRSSVSLHQAAAHVLGDLVSGARDTVTDQDGRRI